jgi:hypothetical protein
MHKLWKRADQGKTSKKVKKNIQHAKNMVQIKTPSTEYLSRRPKVQIRTLYESLMHSRRLGEGGDGGRKNNFTDSACNLRGCTLDTGNCFTLYHCAGHLYFATGDICLIATVFHMILYTVQKQLQHERINFPNTCFLGKP